MKVLVVATLLMLALLLLGTPAVATHDDVLTPSALPVVGDFDGDGTLDLGVAIDGQVYIARSQAGAIHADPSTLFGLASDFVGSLPVLMDYDGDGKTDIAWFLRATRQFVILPSAHPLTFVICTHLECITYPRYAP